MFLRELFDGPEDVTGDIKENLMDILTPMVASHVPFVTVQQIIDKLKDHHFGVTIDRNFIMTLLDPDEIKIIDKIEGDRIYLSNPKSSERKLDKSDTHKEMDHVDDLAKGKAKQNMQPNQMGKQ